MGAGPSSSSSSFDSSSIPPSPSANNHNHRIRHVSSSGRLSRTPKRESPFPLPHPGVLPALPPLIPVSKITSPTPATPSTPLSASGAARLKGHSLSSIAVHDSRTALATDSNLGLSGRPADFNLTETEKVPTGKPNTEPTATSGPGFPSGPGQEPTTSVTVIAPPENLTASDKNTQDTTTNGNSNNTNTEAEANTEETDESSTWPEHPRQFLERVKETVSKAELGTLLSKGSDSFHQAVLRIHMESFDFRRDPIDLALRKFLLDFHFPKEAQQIDRVLEAFAGQYHACNPHLFRSSGKSYVVYTIAFSLMLLHTDAHNKNVRYKMSKDQYVRQAKSIDGVNTIPADILEVLYDNITYLKFVYAEDEMDVDGQRIAEVQPNSASWFPRRRTASNQRADSYNMIRHGSIAHLAPDLTDLIPFRWPYYWKGTIEMVDNVQINNQFTRAPLTHVPGLRSRGHGQYLPHEPSNLGQGVHSIRPETMIHLDSERDPSAEVARRYNDNVVVSQDDGSADLKIVKFGVLSRKIDVENGKKSAVRGWRDLGIILSGSQLLFFTDTTWFQQQRVSNVGFNPQDPPEEDGFFASDMRGGLPSMPQALISTLDSIAVIDSSYQKYPHVFRLVCPNGKQYLFRSESEHEMNDWMAKINYASAFKTAGVRLRNYRVAWADDVFWIKDEQGRHQLRRRQKAGSPARTEPLDGRSQLLQAKMKDIDRQINACSASLAAELRLARGLEVMIPLQGTTRQKIVQSATVVGKRLRQLMLERTKLDCFRTVLERDLAVVPAERVVSGSSKHARHGLGVSVYGNESLSGTTDYSHTSVGSGTLRSAADGLGQDPNDIDYTKTLRQHPSMPSDHRHRLSHHCSSPSMNDHMDHIKDEYVLDSTRTSQSSNRSMKGPIRPRLQVLDFQRTVSENAIDDGRRSQSINNGEIPMGPMAIQAAIIDAARGTQGTISSTMSSPDPNHYQGPRSLSPNQGASSQQRSQSPNSPTIGPALLTPETSVGRSNTRSRALSMPGQRPNMMPRTVSIYSSSSQTASRLKQIFEQGLGHFKWGSSNQSTPGSSLKTNTFFPPGSNASDPAFVPESSLRS
ncbi:hypothetical protein BGZ96_008566 [Linnemannia gamsii]|uniref:Uncharacterized protein n=1 Tax=Linnemannia gamsii TaxID=64522 RepID=A0ABQ7K080_9FUNG|nr:hypothetical protein BGZ96_008566 [Linnemannia gamsii]